MSGSDAIGLAALGVRIVSQGEELADGVEIQPQLSSMPDETQSFDGAAVENPVTAGTSWRAPEQTEPLVVANGLRRTPAHLRSLANPEIRLHRA